MFHLGEARRAVDSSRDCEETNLKQQAVLDKFFHLLGHLSFDKAREYLEKEKDTAVKYHTVTQFFSSVVSTFSQLAVAEKNYANFTYLGSKGFLRKDLKSMFESLQNEFLRFEARCSNTPVSTPAISPIFPSRTPSPHDLVLPSPSPSETSESGSLVSLGSLAGLSSATPPSDVLENLVCHLCGQLYHFVAARLSLIEFYEKMHSMSNYKLVNLDLLIEMISAIGKHNQKLFHHPLIGPLKASFTYECEILLKLLECQANMQKWKFLPTLLCLQEANAKLEEWTTALKEAKKATIGSSRQTTLPALYFWLVNFKAALLSKYTLYFHKVLSLQTPSHQEMKNLCSKTTEDYFQKIVSFQRRYDAACIALVLDAVEVGDYRGHGYSFPGKPFEAPKGLNSYPAFVCVPPEKPISHWPNLIMIMGNEEFKKPDTSHTFYDKRVNATYFLIKIEPYITMVTIFDGHKSEKDGHIIRFMNLLCTQLRCNKMFAALKP